MKVFDYEALEKEKENFTNLDGKSEMEIGKLEKEAENSLGLDHVYQYLRAKDGKYSKKDFLLIQNTIKSIKEKAQVEKKSDLKYFYLWKIVLRKQQDPKELFKYLAKNEIGSLTSDYYEEYTNYLETGKK
jgi:hypothetical protein